MSADLDAVRAALATIARDPSIYEVAVAKRVVLDAAPGLLEEVERLRAVVAGAKRIPLSEKRKCGHCGRMTRITTAGCDHCDVEDK